jgi:hypothetical protein
MLSGRSTEQLREAEMTLRATGAEVAAHEVLGPTPPSAAATSTAEEHDPERASGRHLKRLSTVIEQRIDRLVVLLAGQA